MNHLWIAYDTLLVAIGIANLVLFHLARDRKPFLSAFAVFYAAFALGLVVALARRYVTFNVGSRSFMAFLSYGASTVLSYSVISWSILGYHRLLNLVRPKRTVLLSGALTAAALLALLPWSVKFEPDNQSYLLESGYYVATGLYLAAFSYVIYLAVTATWSVTDPGDRRFARALLAFALVGFVESTTGFVEDLRHPTVSLGAQGEEFLYSSIPYAAFSLFLALYLLPLILRPSIAAETAPDRSRVAALGLSDREQEVLELLLTGLSNKRIAIKLDIAEATVKTHLNKIFRKANVKSRFELAQSVTGAGPQGPL